MKGPPQQAHAQLAVAGFRFGDCELILTAHELRVSGRTRSIEPRAFDLLLFLVMHRDRVVTKQELRDALWEGRSLCDGVLTQCIWTARKALGETGGRNSLIRTVTGVGYRFVGDVVEIEARAPSEAPPRPTISLVMDPAVPAAARQLARSALAQGDASLTLSDFHEAVAIEADLLGLTELAALARALSEGAASTERIGHAQVRRSGFFPAVRGLTG